MSNSKKEKTGHPDQLSLLSGQQITEGRLADTAPALRAALVAAIKECPLSRYQIAARISELMSRDVTKEMLDKYCAESAEGHRIPAEILPAFCFVTGSRRPLELLAASIGCTVSGPEESRELEIVRLRLEKMKLEEKIKSLERRAPR